MEPRRPCVCVLCVQGAGDRECMTRLEMSLKQSSIEKYLSSSQSTQSTSSTVLASTCSGEDDSQQLSNDEDPEQDWSTQQKHDVKINTTILYFI